jgi:mono/diheme cytochrome c family protein
VWTAARAITAVALATAVSGCGGQHAQSGQRIYERSCSGCHSLTGHEVGADGGDLATLHLGVRDLTSFARVMPVTPPLTRAQALAVARYVRSAER